MENGNSKEQYSEWKSTSTLDNNESLPNVESERHFAVHTYLDNIQPEELQQRVFDALKTTDDPLRRKIQLRELNLPEAYTEKELEEAIKVRIELYKERSERVKEFARRFQDKLANWLEQQKLVPAQNPKSIPVYVNDYLLHSGVENDFPDVFGEMFDAQTNVVTVTGKYDSNIIAHEYFHAMGYNPTTKDAGFRKHIEGRRIEGNLWLDEGVTMMGEFATHPTEIPNRRDHVDEMYDDGYFWLTQVYMQEIGVSQDELMRAYFGEEPYRNQLEEKTKQRFGCNITELGNIFFGYTNEAKKQTMQIIKGVPIVLEAMEGSGLDEKYLDLKRFFPNIEVVILPRPNFEME